MSEDNLDILIRKMDPGDAAVAAAIDQICFAAPWSLKSFEYETSENPLALYLVAEIPGGGIVGYAGIWNILDEGHITNVAVLPEFRGKGIARRLIADIIERSMAEGAVRFTLEVRVSNGSARKVYEKFGFVETGLRKNYYEDNGEDAIIMWKEKA